jgi:putative flippase GtrA
VPQPEGHTVKPGQVGKVEKVEKVGQNRAPSLLNYLLVGVAATLAHWAFMVMLVERLGLAAWLASGAGAVLGAQVAFFANRDFTFGHVGHARQVWSAWWRFMATAALIAVVGMALVAGGVAWGLHYMVAQAVATVVGVLLGFAINRAWTFAAKLEK